MSRFTIIVRYRFAPAWLRLTRAERRAHEARFRADVLGPHLDRITLQHCDAEAFAADYSDFLIIGCDDLTDYYHFIEALRDSDLIAQEWARIHDITIGIPDGYRDYERATAC